MNVSVVMLRMLHGIFTAYFIACLIALYVSAFTKHVTTITAIAIASLAIEGFFVYVLNQGNCPLIHIQKKIGDPVPFFSLLMPAPLAKRAMPTFAVLTLFGALILAMRYTMR